MSLLRAAIDPHMTADTVFFVGNGALRVAPNDAADRGGGRLLSPSWSEYMDSLWSFIHDLSGSPDLLALEDFSRLPAPRQAEWFDRRFREYNDAQVDVAALRLHLLGRTLHRDDSVLSNPLFQQLARLLVRSAASRSADVAADVITTNVDCALEQNIAWAIEKLCGLGPSGEDESSHDYPAISVRRATIESIVDFRLSARWEMSAARSGQDLRIRLWKLHGCLRDLKIRLSRDSDMTGAVLGLAGDTGMSVCGHVPINELGADLSGDWKQAHEPDGESSAHSGVFSHSEYFRNMLVIAGGELGTRGAASASVAPGEEQGHNLADFRQILFSRPLIFVGYSIPDVDVDVVYALQQYRQRSDDIKRWQLVARRECSASTDERLRQMGIEPWPFDVSNIGYAAIPGKLRAARRHEWRSVAADPLALPPDKDWRRALERAAGQAWLEPQVRALRSLAPVGIRSDAIPAAGSGHRLVVAGLASIWHGFALTRSADFPVPRRVSAQLIAVDAQVPGGSGLVPAMIAAAASGPAGVGSMVFFSNAPPEWSSWEEIEDMCLSAGISVHPWNPGPGVNEDGLQSVGRTSHVILFDPTGEDVNSRLPRQRLIMDVQTLANETLAPQVENWSSLRVPSARLQDDFQQPGEEDFLFTDKESDPQIIASWSGPTIYETGASGDELVTRLQKIGVRPTIWTAGVGSFVRTLVAVASRVPDDATYASGPQGVLRHLEEDPRLAVFAACGDLRERYLAKVISFGRRGIWDSGGVGFTYQDELEYGIWLRDRWPELEGPIRELLQTDANGILSKPHPRIGSGLLTTIHEGGLMALWLWPDGSKEQISVRIDTAQDNEDPGCITVGCAVNCATGQQQIDPIYIHIRDDQVVLAVAGLEEKLGPSDPIRRNTLAAGDAVRGAMAYGLWTAAYRSQTSDKQVDIRKIFLACAALASAKCYAGSFVDFLKLIERLRGTPIWTTIWGF